MWQDNFDDESGGIYYTMPGTGEVSWTRPSSLDITDPAEMTEDELRVLIRQAGWEDGDVDYQNLLALGQEALAAIVAQEVAATYDANEWEDPGNVSAVGGSGDQWEDPGNAAPEADGGADKWEDPGLPNDEIDGVNNEWNEEGAGSEWVGEIDENGDGENGCNATSPVEETPVWIEKNDDDSGAPYYVNSSSPYYVNSSSPYYVNSSSGEIVWEIPFEEPKAIEQAEDVYGESEAVVVEEGSASANIEPGNERTELWDDETGAVYYQHNTSGELMWEAPWQTSSAIDTQLKDSANPDTTVDSLGEATSSFDEAGTSFMPSAVAHASPVGSGPVAARSLRVSAYAKHTGSPSASGKVGLSPKNLPSIVPRISITKSNSGTSVAPSPQYSKTLKPLHLEQPLKGLDKGSFDSSSRSIKAETPHLRQ